jgi:hypothetical protein
MLKYVRNAAKVRYVSLHALLLPLQEMKLDPSKPYQPRPSGQESLLHSADAPPPVMDITK